MKKYYSQLKFKYWLGGLIGGPGISFLLQKWIIPNPSEWLVALVYTLGFGIYALIIFLSYRQQNKKIEFLKFMVHTREEKKQANGYTEIKDYGRVDSNSVKIIDRIINDEEMEDLKNND